MMLRVFRGVGALSGSIRRFARRLLRPIMLLGHSKWRGVYISSCFLVHEVDRKGEHASAISFLLIAFDSLVGKKNMLILAFSSSSIVFHIAPKLIFKREYLCCFMHCAHRHAL